MHIFQSLDLTVNKFAKKFAKQRFSESFSRQIKIVLENVQEHDDNQIDYRLTNLKPDHAKWLMYFIIRCRRCRENKI